VKIVPLLTQIGLLEKVQARALQSEIDAYHRPMPQLLLVTIELSGGHVSAPLLRGTGVRLPGASGLLGMAPGVLLDWRHCRVDLVVILHHEIDIGREFHGLRGRFQF